MNSQKLEEIDDGDRLASIDIDQDEFDRDGQGTEGGVISAPRTMKEKQAEKVTWMSLPCKKQLIVLTLARLSEPLVQTSLQVSLLNAVKHFRCLVGYLWLEGYG